MRGNLEEKIVSYRLKKARSIKYYYAQCKKNGFIQLDEDEEENFMDIN
jgi:hypothetical protein